MLQTNATLSYKKRTGTDVYGTETLSAAKTEGCATVRFRVESQHTTVRADSSGSRGFADEFAASTKILVLANTGIDIGDQVTLLGISLRITSRFPRVSVAGVLDHYELQGTPWV